ncbi:hypothetical protein DUI87_27586 [Hirundo rustica rustica]|uniref:Uncharacterized protein n=1 Tax=Hirundo rustica rustica TaxID=333673 RepID=A0A3M0JM87_HIRRU|nr:hypothetical protein DUI87_27586 [Hirundo rustica rustica]
MRGGAKDHQSANDMLPNDIKNDNKTSPDVTIFTDHDLSKPILSTDSRHSPYRLRLTEGLHLRTTDWVFASVNTEEQGSWPVEEGEFIVIGDCKHTPLEIEILPGTLVNNPGRIVLWLRCAHPPTYLAKGQVIAQMIPTRGSRVTSETLMVCPVQAITEERPRVACEFSVGGEALKITGLLDTGADVTVVPAKDWPSHWALQNVAGHVQGVGGLQLAKQSKSVVQIKGPGGQLANIRPFVLNYKEPLLGRDLMSQWGVTIDIPDPSQDFSVAVTEERRTQKLNWLTDSPVWVEQWPLSKEKLKALEELVEEQLAKGHIVETNSPWNSPVFVIKKPGKDKWRLLHDLRQINNVIEDMGSLQPGMPSPTMLPQNWQLAIVDIKDCFFQIPLHPDDAPRFAFSVPTINRAAPRKRYHWRVLPQGMKNSPVICQWFVASLLSPVRAAADKAIIHHYMDDVLVCAPNDDVLSHALDLTINALIAAGFELQEEKVQRMPPWRYLGLEISKRTIVPQKLEIKTNVSTLADLHQLCGALNWVRPWLGLTTEDLAPLFNLLKGGEELCSPRTLTPEAKSALEKVQDCMSTRQAHRCDPGLPFKFIVMGRLPHLHGVIFQWSNTTKKDRGGNDPLLIIEWVFLSHQRSKRMTRPQELVAELIRKARSRIRDLAGCDFQCIHIPIGLKSGQITKAMLEHLLQENEALQFALDSFTGQISIHRPAHKIFNQDVQFVLSVKSVQSRKPLEALTVFTDASGRSHKSVMTWKDPQTQQWEADIAEVEGSPQVAELAAVRAFEKFPEPFNLVTDSAYVAGVVSRAEQAILQEVSNIALFELLSKLIKLVSHREHSFYVMHTRSHTELPGFIADGNRRADALAAPVAMAPLPNVFEQAKLSHQLFHQNAPGLVRRFHLTREQAKAIVAACPSCSKYALPTLSAGVNPRGLKSCEVWQTDVTHFPEFGRSKFVHVSVDTFSGTVFASAHTGEKSLDAIKHLIQAFSFMGIPRELKTDNGPAYRSREFCSFLQQWGVEHKTGIPHSPTGQAVVERTHRDIKRVLHQQQQVLKTEPPSIRLARALFTINFLNCSFEGLNPPVVRHFGANPQFHQREKPPVMVRDPETGRTEGPHELVTWGRGYACVSTPTGPKWVPSKWVRPYVPKVSGSHGKKSIQVTEAAWRRRRRDANWQRKLSRNSAIQKRDLSSIDPDCDHEIVHWSKAKGVAVTIFLPWVAIAKALGELAHLECWVAKQANLTTDALTNLLGEAETSRQATLQNRAAIDYLLLLHGHRCEEFEGLCCFNLSSKAENIHATIQRMKEMITSIKRETGGWLDELFGNWGLTGWVSSTLKTLMLCLFILLLTLICFGLLKRMILNLISTSRSPSINRVAVEQEEQEQEEEEIEMDRMEDDEGRNPDLKDHGLGYPTQHEWFASSYPNSEYLPPPFQFTSS